MSRIIIGTAGHIDHGKTALVKALTGVDTDRLKEEKERGITIELGFASLALPNGTQAALVDVPGHERFIKNMLAGAAGIDLALLIVAANEGVMPQTREHLDILRLLEIKEVIVVISKIDLVEEDFLQLIQEEIRETLAETPYGAAPMVKVATLTGQGIDSLLRLLEETIQALPARQVKEGLTRLPVDRAFTVQGFGTVVTGTLFNGVMKTGDYLEIPTKAEQVKVRKLQVHGKSMPEAQAGQRVAVNLSGGDANLIKRGDVLITPGSATPTNRLDLSVHLLKNAPWGLQDMARVRFHQGTKETIGRVFVLGQEAIEPGKQGFIQVVLEEPVVVMRDDNYILRSYSPVHTIGGGRIIEPLALKHKKKETDLKQRLQIKASGEIDKIAQLILEESHGLVNLQTLAKRLGFSKEEMREITSRLCKIDQAIEVKGAEEGVSYLSSVHLIAWEKIIAREITAHLQESPLSPGLNKETIRTKLGATLNTRDFNALLQIMVERQVIRVNEGQFLVPAVYVQEISDKIAAKLEKVAAIYREKGWQLPDWKEVKALAALNEKEDNQIIAYLTRDNKLIQLTDELYLSLDQYYLGLEALRTWFRTNTELTVAQFRDLLGTTRKIAVPLLEYLDKKRFTVKIGDIRQPGLALFDRELET